MPQMISIDMNPGKVVLFGLRPQHLDWGRFARFATPDFGALWSAVFGNVWAQWRFENDAPIVSQVPRSERLREDRRQQVSRDVSREHLLSDRTQTIEIHGETGRKFAVLGAPGVTVRLDVGVHATADRRPYSVRVPGSRAGGGPERGEVGRGHHASRRSREQSNGTRQLFETLLVFHRGQAIEDLRRPEPRTIGRVPVAIPVPPSRERNHRIDRALRFRVCESG